MVKPLQIELQNDHNLAQSATLHNIRLYPSMTTENTTADLLAELAKIDAAALDNDPDVKTKALALSRQLTTVLESPMDRAVEYMFKVCQSPAELFGGIQFVNATAAIFECSHPYGSWPETF
jgi:hypothetical protein